MVADKLLDNVPENAAVAKWKREEVYIECRLECNSTSTQQ